jgi:hypothetical protein
VYSGLIKPAVTAASLLCDRDDEDTGGRLIAEHIFDKIERADLVLCDLSSHNPNVAVELGWALRADKPFVLIKDDKTAFFFDLNQYYTYSYSSGLQPTTLTREIPQLAAVIRSTLEDTDRRYSVVHRLSVSLSAIRALKHADDPLLAMIADVQQRVRQLTLPGRLEQAEADRFPWPRLLRYATSVLDRVSRFVDDLVDESDLIRTLDPIVASMGASLSHEIQVSVVNEDRIVLYHCWDSVIGTRAHYLAADGNDVFEDVLKCGQGAVSWIDRSTNVFDPSRPIQVRMNIALFSSVRNARWRVVVEAHHEFRSSWP